MGPWPGFYWPGAVPLVLMTITIALSAWRPYFSLTATAALLLGQLLYVFPPMFSNHWAIYLGSFIALGFIMWRGSRLQRIVAASSNLMFAAVMTYMMISLRYGQGVGWFRPLFMGDRIALSQYWWQLFPLLLLVAAACGTAGILLALYEDRGTLSKAQALTQASLRETSRAIRVRSCSTTNSISPARCVGSFFGCHRRTSRRHTVLESGPTQTCSGSAGEHSYIRPARLG